MSRLGDFIEIVTSQGEPDLEVFHSMLNEVITPDGECIPADADDLEIMEKQFSGSAVWRVEFYSESALHWLSRILINQCITHFDLKHQQMLAAFIDRLLRTESPAYVDVLYKVKHYFMKADELLQSTIFHGVVNALNKRLAHHHLTENHANKLMMSFLKTGASDANADANEKSVFLKILNGSAEEGSPFQWQSIVKDEEGLCTPFALTAIKSFSTAEFIFYIKKLASQSANKVILTAPHREALHKALDYEAQEGGMDGVIELLASFRLLGINVDAKDQLGRDILPDIRDTFIEEQSEEQSNDLLQIISQKIKSSGASLSQIRENLLSAHQQGLDLGALEYDLLNTLPNLDKETALLLFTSKALQAQSEYYVVRDGGVCDRQGGGYLTMASIELFLQPCSHLTLKFINGRLMNV